MQTLQQIEQSILPWLGRTMKLVDYYMVDCFAEHKVPLTRVQMILLIVLSKQNGQPQHSLAFLTNRDKTSLARLLATMERKGLVERKPDTKDLRSKLVFITPAGHHALDTALPVLNRVIKTIQTGITSQEMATTLKVLKQILVNVKTA